MEKVLNFIRLIADSRARSIKGNLMKNEVTKFINNLGTPTKAELQLFDDIIRKQDFSILTKVKEEAPWEKYRVKPYDDNGEEDIIALYSFPYLLLSGQACGDDSELDELLRDIYYDSIAGNYIIEYEQVNNIVWDWVKSIIDKVFPFIMPAFVTDWDNKYVEEELEGARVLRDLTRFAYLWSEFKCMDDSFFIKLMANPIIPLHERYSDYYIKKLADIAKSGDYVKINKSFGSNEEDENVMLSILDSYTIMDINEDERINLENFTRKLQSFFGSDGSSKPFESFSSRMSVKSN